MWKKEAPEQRGSPRGGGEEARGGAWQCGEGGGTRAERGAEGERGRREGVMALAGAWQCGEGGTRAQSGAERGRREAVRHWQQPADVEREAQEHRGLQRGRGGGGQKEGRRTPAADADHPPVCACGHADRSPPEGPP